MATLGFRISRNLPVKSSGVGEWGEGEGIEWEFTFIELLSAIKKIIFINYFLILYTIRHKQNMNININMLAVPRRLFCFGSLVILDVARCYLWLFTLYINIKISKNSCLMLD